MLVVFWKIENTLFLARPKCELLSFLLQKTRACLSTVKKDLNGVSSFFFAARPALSCEEFDLCVPLFKAFVTQQIIFDL